MPAMLTFALAAAVAVGTLPESVQDVRNRGAQVHATATVTILRAEIVSEATGPGGLTRHVGHRESAAPTIIFE